MARILVVEDSQTQAGQLIGPLEARGFDAASVPDAEQTLAVFRGRSLRHGDFRRGDARYVRLRL